MSERHRILIVEDEATDADLLERELREAGLAFDALRVETAEGLLRALASFRPDVVLSDYNLPRLDGMTALRHVKAHSPHVPFLLVTGSLNEETAVECMKAGATDYVLKDRLKRIGPALLVALAQKKSEQAKDAAERALRDALRDSAQEWQRTFDAVEFPILIADLGGRVSRVNRAGRDLLGQPDAEIIGRPLAQFAELEPWRTAARLSSQVAASGSAAFGQARDASGRVWSLTARPLEGPAPDERRVILDARDVTRETEMQENLRRGELLSALGSLVAGVAHEVRNPLFSISSNIDAFEAQLGARQEFATMVSVLRSEVARLSSLMQDLLDYGRPPSSEREVWPVEGVVREALQRCEPLARDVSVSVPAPEGAGTSVSMDRNRLGLVFRNLVENAIQHSPPFSTVEVSVARRREAGTDFVEVRVEDGGPGFREEDLSEIFAPFFTRRRGGTGLGLSIVHKVVLEHGGQVKAVNRPGGGACLSVRLPCAEAPPGLAGGEPPRSRLAASFVPPSFGEGHAASASHRGRRRAHPGGHAHLLQPPWVSRGRGFRAGRSRSPPRELHLLLRDRRPSAVRGPRRRRPRDPGVRQGAVSRHPDHPPDRLQLPRGRSGGAPARGRPVHPQAQAASRGGPAGRGPDRRRDPPVIDGSVLEKLVVPGALSPVFQPIFDIREGGSSLHALEALMRGPKGTNFEHAGVLFEYVRRRHEEALIDRACFTAALEAAASLPLSPRISINVHASTLAKDPASSISSSRPPRPSASCPRASSWSSSSTRRSGT